MLRKIFCYSIILAVVLWLAGTYYLKSRVLQFLDTFESANVKLSYENVSVGGFPFHWDIILNKPRITLISQSVAQEISADSLEFRFNYYLKSVRVNIPKTLEYSFNKSEEIQKYMLLSDHNIMVDIDFSKYIYTLSNSNYRWCRHDIKSITSKVSPIHIKRDGNTVFSINNLDAQLLQHSLDHYTVKLTSNYRSDIKYSNISKANIVLSVNYLIKNTHNTSDQDIDCVDHQLSLNTLKINIDHAVLHMSGVLNLAHSSVPYGNISVSMVQYQNIVDNLLPERFFISKSSLKKIIAKSCLNLSDSVTTNNPNIKLQINFTDQGIFIGNTNLLDLHLNKQPIHRLNI